MIGRRCKHSNVFSRPVLIARNLLSSQISFPGSTESRAYLSQVIYCGGYSGVEPPLPIPNREVKRTSADGTAPPGGRVGRCRFSEARLTFVSRASFVSAYRPPRKNRKAGSALRDLHIRGKDPPDAPSVGFASELNMSGNMLICCEMAKHYVRFLPYDVLLIPLFLDIYRSHPFPLTAADVATGRRIHPRIVRGRGPTDTSYCEAMTQ